LLLDDGPAARQLALGLHALVEGGVLLVEAVGAEVARQVVLPRRLGAVLAQIDAHLLFLRHVASSPYCTRGPAASSSRRGRGWTLQSPPPPRSPHRPRH